jgi:hypothetical protein
MEMFQKATNECRSCVLLDRGVSLDFMTILLQTDTHLPTSAKSLTRHQAKQNYSDFSHILF